MQSLQSLIQHLLQNSRTAVIQLLAYASRYIVKWDFLNEYMYQEALDISLEENGIEKVKEYYFSVTYHGRQIQHKHYVDFLVNNDVLVECKAVECLGSQQRQQLWNYMRLTKICIGILYNFAPVHDQCERYYLDKDTGNMYLF